MQPAFTVRLVSGYAHVFVLLSVVIVQYPLQSLLPAVKHLRDCIWTTSAWK